jgi:hypothetical protein
MAYGWNKGKSYNKKGWCTKREVMDREHFNLYPGAEDCMARHKEYIWPAMEEEHAIIIADSLLKRVRYLKRATVHAIPGAKIERFIEEISQGRINMSFQKAALIHLGTNNLEKDSPSEITRKMADLVDLIKAKNPEVKIMVSGIIMRPQDEKTDVKYTRKGKTSLASKRREANSMIEDMVRERGGFQMQTWIPLMKGHAANPDMYWEDGLHLSVKGLEKITAYLVQNLGRFLPRDQSKCVTRMGLI